MHRFSRLRPSPATVIAMIALAVALGGTGYAAIVLPANTVGTKQLRPNAVTSGKVKDGTLLSTDFKSGQLPAGAPGTPGVAGPSGPSDAYSGLKNGPVAVPALMTTLATLNIPSAGKVVVVAKAWIHDNVNTAVVVPCQLVAGGDSDVALGVLEGNSGTAVSYLTLSFNVVHEFAGSGTVQLQCQAFGVNVEIGDIKITAIKVGNLTNTGL